MDTQVSLYFYSLLHILSFSKALHLVLLKFYLYLVLLILSFTLFYVYLVFAIEKQLQTERVVIGHPSLVVLLGGKDRALGRPNLISPWLLLMLSLEKYL